MQGNEKVTKTYFPDFQNMFRLCRVLIMDLQVPVKNRLVQSGYAFAAFRMICVVLNYWFMTTTDQNRITVKSFQRKVVLDNQGPYLLRI